jgi:hypothetical protein
MSGATQDNDEAAAFAPSSLPNAIRILRHVGLVLAYKLLQIDISTRALIIC